MIGLDGCLGGQGRIELGEGVVVIAVDLKVGVVHVVRVVDLVVSKYDGLATRVVSYFTGSDVVRDPTRFERWGDLARRVIAAA